MKQQLRPQVWPLVAVLVALFFAYEAGSQQFTARGAWFPGPLRVEYIPDPNDIVNLAEGTPYTVPAGKVLIITDWVTTDAEVAENQVLDGCRLAPRISVDGVEVWGGGYSSKRQNTDSLATTGTGTLTGVLRTGIRVDAGEMVTLATLRSPSTGWSGDPSTFASGYLADAE